MKGQEYRSVPLRALQPYAPLWIEGPVFMNQPEGLGLKLNADRLITKDVRRRTSG